MKYDGWLNVAFSLRKKTEQAREQRKLTDEQKKELLLERAFKAALDVGKTPQATQTWKNLIHIYDPRFKQENDINNPGSEVDIHVRIAKTIEDCEKEEDKIL